MILPSSMIFMRNVIQIRIFFMFKSMILVLKTPLFHMHCASSFITDALVLRLRTVFPIRRTTFHNLFVILRFCLHCLTDAIACYSPAMVFRPAEFSTPCWWFPSQLRSQNLFNLATLNRLNHATHMSACSGVVFHHRFNRSAIADICHTSPR